MWGILDSVQKAYGRTRDEIERAMRDDGDAMEEAEGRVRAP